MTPLLLAYDAEAPRCRALADWVRQRDPRGMVTTFPLQAPELAAVAPELGGLPPREVLGVLDLGTREVWGGAEALVPILRRLPGWSWVAPLGAAPGGRWLLERYYLRLAGRHVRA